MREETEEVKLFEVNKSVRLLIEGLESQNTSLEPEDESKAQ